MKELVGAAPSPRLIGGTPLERTCQYGHVTDLTARFWNLRLPSHLKPRKSTILKLALTFLRIDTSGGDKVTQARLPRAQAELDVDMIVDGSTMRHKTHNVGLGGVLIDAGKQPLPEPGTEVELNFLGLQTIPARVLRASEKGIALIFEEVNEEAFRFLSALLLRRAV